VGAFVALIAVLATDFLGLRTKLLNFLTNLGGAIANAAGNVVDAASEIAVSIAQKIGGLVGDAIEWGQNIVRNLADGVATFVSNVTSAIGDVSEAVTSTITGLVSSAVEWGQNLIQEFIRGIRNKIGDLRTAMNDVADTIRSRLPGSPAETGPLSDLDQAGPGLVDTFSAGIDANLPTIQQSASNTAEAAEPSGRLNTANNFSFNIDGRELNERTGRFDRDKTARRGID
jgi:hypothetical protein